MNNYDLFFEINRCNRGYLKNKTQCDHMEKTEQPAIELGHCFLLGDRYTKAFNATEASSDITAEKT
jgi:prolyl-tRNA synthetase